MHSGIKVLASLLLVAGTALAQGTITGTVVDETGKPLAGAKVHITERDRLVGHRLIQSYETDASGCFRISDVPWGTYFVLAAKEGAGYPDPEGTFYSDNVAPTVTLAEGLPSADLIVKLGPKAGVLELGPVTDSATGKAIPLASVTVRRASDPNLFISASVTQRRLLIPALTDVLIEISADGYEAWPPAAEQAEGRLFLKSQEIRKLSVALQARPPATAVK